MKPYLTAAISFFLPSYLAIRILRLLGHNVSNEAYIGFSWIQCEKLFLDKKASIGHFNLIRIDKIQIGKEGSIRSYNRLKGPFDLIMGEKAAIGNSNSIYRGPFPITCGSAAFTLGKLTIVTSKHQIDCTKSISIGDFSTISGFGTQIWTHGFYHADHGPYRIRIDGEIIIGKNVSIGSRCLLNPGIQIVDAINVGGNACVSKSLIAPGMYVSHALRHIPNDIKTIKRKLTRNQTNKYVEVYEK